MSQIAILQYKRGPKRLQIIVFPWEIHLAHSAILRIWDKHTLSAHSGWRGVPALTTIPITLGINETIRFEADAGVEEVMQSPWINNGAHLEVRELIDLEPSDVVDLQNSRSINELLKRLSDQVDNWV